MLTKQISFLIFFVHLRVPWIHRGWTAVHPLNSSSPSRILTQQLFKYEVRVELGNSGQLQILFIILNYSDDPKLFLCYIFTSFLGSFQKLHVGWWSTHNCLGYSGSSIYPLDGKHPPFWFNKGIIPFS